MSFEFAKSNEKKRLEAEQKELEQKIIDNLDKMKRLYI